MSSFKKGIFSVISNCSINICRIYISYKSPWGHYYNFLICVCSYIREKEMEEEALMQRREEEGKGRERRRALLEREERKWKELEISLLSSIPNTGSRDAAAMSAAVRAVGGDSALEDSFARDRVSSIANHIRKSQLARRAEQVLSPD